MTERVVWVNSPQEKTDLLNSRAVHGALHPRVRAVAVRLVLGVPENGHVERLQRLHRFVRSHTYVREAVERFQVPWFTLMTGAGDCDDLAALLGALAWSVKYPFRVIPQGSGPAHYSCMLGYPEASHPHGMGSQSRWLAAETTPVGDGYTKLPLGAHSLAHA